MAAAACCCRCCGRREVCCTTQSAAAPLPRPLRPLRGSVTAPRAPFCLSVALARWVSRPLLVHRYCDPLGQNKQVCVNAARDRWPICATASGAFVSMQESRSVQGRAPGPAPCTCAASDRAQTTAMQARAISGQPLTALPQGRPCRPCAALAAPCRPRSSARGRGRQPSCRPQAVGQGERRRRERRAGGRQLV